MKHLIALKKTKGDEPFEYYVFTEFNSDDDIAELIIDDNKRYDKILELSNIEHSIALVAEVEMGNFTDPRITVLR